ncbi:hypothetical protein [Achromobacter deleyi]|uniref:hypothetical protein n=1 Tax=Achromobacter deleyi TaxID=1353891 RepID=UPI001465636D|nr:hypothetical protein [Achromobacter deleyi]CAB3928937.1 hypothetical protein LMG3412_06541 [Achromobacter deleyi]
MSTINEGGPAFPISRESSIGKNYEGMSLRDFFAAKALSGLAGRKFHKGDRDEGYAHWAASMAYEFADAMLAARGAQ